jgi:hypothetical protein
MYMYLQVNISNIAAARTPFSMDIMKIPQGQGSGFIWDDKGHIVTNAHVVRGAFEVRVSLIDQSVYKAKLVGKDDSKDIAVLQLDAPQEVIRQLRPIQLGSSTGLFVGQRVLAIGNPCRCIPFRIQGLVVCFQFLRRSRNLHILFFTRPQHARGGTHAMSMYSVVSISFPSHPPKKIINSACSRARSHPHQRHHLGAQSRAGQQFQHRSAQRYSNGCCHQSW